MSEAPSAEFQLAFLNHIQRLFEEGEFVATYKYALLISLAEIAVEKGDDSGSPFHISIQSIAGKFIELYWRQIKPYKSVQTPDAAVLIQNKGIQAAIPNLVAGLQKMHASLADARQMGQWDSAIAEVSNTIKKMPLWKLQTLRSQKVIFLYIEDLVDGGIELLPGVAFCLRQFNGFIMNLARNAWISHVRSNPLNRSIVGDNNDLEAFMFGVDRGSLVAIRDLLTDLQKNNCFYCQNLIRNSGAIDHFIPWSRYPRDITQNFVFAHDRCNGDKSDLLPASGHLAHWRERNELYRSELAAFTNATIISDELTSLGVARWAYAHALAAKSQVWVGPGVTEALDTSYQSILA
jgi:hypothetical protein